MARAANPQTCSPPLSLQALQAENRRLLARNEHLLPLAQEAVWRRKLDAVPQKQLSASGKIILARIRRTINGRKEPTPLFFPEIAKDIGMSEDTIGSVIKNQLAPAGALLRTMPRSGHKTPAHPGRTWPSAQRSRCTSTTHPPEPRRAACPGLPRLWAR